MSELLFRTVEEAEVVVSALQQAFRFYRLSLGNLPGVSRGECEQLVAWVNDIDSWPELKVELAKPHETFYCDLTDGMEESYVNALVNVIRMDFGEHIDSNELLRVVRASGLGFSPEYRARRINFVNDISRLEMNVYQWNEISSLKSAYRKLTDKELNRTELRRLERLHEKQIHRILANPDPKNWVIWSEKFERKSQLAHQ
nr:hypothetical protein [uncultured Rhodoferax sp.]